MPKVYILILNYKNWQDVIDCLETVLRSTYKNYHVIVIDNHSGNDSLEHIAQWVTNDAVKSNIKVGFSQQSIDRPVPMLWLPADDWDNDSAARLPVLTLVQASANKGFAAGMNCVIKHLVAEDAYAWLLNPDMIVQEKTLEELVRFASGQTRRAIIGAHVKLYYKPAETHVYGGGRINFNTATISMLDEASDPASMDYVSGASMFLHTASFLELGLLPEEYFLYWEETDWCYRARLKGYKLLVCPGAICFDKVSGSVGRSFLADYYYTRNGLAFVAKYKRGKIIFALVSSIFRAAKRLAFGQWSRANGVYRGVQDFIKQ
jgi:GT2 family glycosyltransferase